MDHSPKPASSMLNTQPDREATCPVHGAFMSRNLFGQFWSKCSKCAAEQQAEIDREKAEAEKQRAEARHQAMLASARIPARFIGRTFENFTAETPEKLHALTVVRDFVQSFDENAKLGRGLILSGLPGTGKSHLAAAALQELMHLNVCYMTCLDLIRSVRDTWRRDSEQSESEVLRYVECLDLLVIDEVGAQYGTDGEQTILFDVLDRRYREMQPTILLTNQDSAGLKSFVGDRSFDRLRETCRMVSFSWPSYRPQARQSAKGVA